MRLILFLGMVFVAPFFAFGQVKTVVIDPGHGGNQPGTVWGQTYEKDIVLEVGLLLGQMIEGDMPGVKVVYTRTKDVQVDLARRAKAANDAKADLFISIHVNATEPDRTPPSGALTLVIGKDNEKGNLDMAMKENDAIFYEDDYTTVYKDYLSGSNEMFIIYSLMQYANIDKSIRFASAVQKQMKNTIPMNDLGIRRQRLLVLGQTTMPGVLVELGFLNNARDREVLTSAEGKRKAAESLLAAVKDYSANMALSAEVEEPKLTAKSNVRNVATKPKEVVSEPARVAASQGAEMNAALSTPESVAFAVQIYSLSRKIPAGDPALAGYKPIEQYRGGRYRYYVGPFGSRAEAEAKLPEIRLTFRDAFITTIQL